ncbi:uncharacterized protein LOC124369126 [Homalodisca vitripennis]|uniref:uncharacterized protein LOC124369126 n=1 Tax=Homalodisca vitripennis TaxID=197043 RepID=UPI001EEBD3DF|nr:uncharacterized protein LOC124369126 [Homalodisca vitripennis]
MLFISVYSLNFEIVQFSGAYMARINVVRIKVSHLKGHLAEYYLLACNNANDFYCEISETSPIEYFPSSHEAMSSNKLWVLTPAKRALCLEDHSVNFEFGNNHVVGKEVVEEISQKTYFISFNNSEKFCLTCLFNLKPQTACNNVLSLNGYAVSLFLHYLYISQKYLELVANHLAKNCSTLFRLQGKGFKVHQSELQINLIDPENHIMDIQWAKMACTTVHELRQLQYAMSWLSTLGGAFSALGEDQERCAKAAGMISIEQLRLALRLGDDVIIAQCKLYFSLSLIQRGMCQLAKRIIQEQYNSMKKRSVVDKKTINMCKGIWARLKYQLKKQRRSKKNFGLGV